MTGRTDKGTRGTPRLARGGSGGDWDNLPPAPPPTVGEEFDALTDLFLGEVGNAKSARAVSGDTPTGGAARNSRSQPVLRLAGIADDPELDDAPEPSFTPSKTKLTHQAAPDEARVEVPARSTRRRAAATTSSAIVECIVLGHLPILAAAWGAQYVREVAMASGRPVAYLRLQHGYASIELIGGDGSTATMPSAKTIEEGMRLAAQRTQRWVVRADTGDEARLAASPLVRVVTLLTGVDEAAVVAAYGSVKALAASLGQAVATDGSDQSGAEGPMIRIAAMGAPADRAKPAADRLAEAVTRFVGREVDTAVCGARIASARPSEVLFTGRTDIALAEAMELLGRTADETEVIERPVASAPAMKPEDRAPEAIDTRETAERVPGVEPVRPPEMVAAPVVKAAPREVPVPAVAAPVSSAVLAAAVAQEPLPELERAEVLEDSPSALALLLPGLRPVSVRCPYAEGIEFAVDRAGTVHLLSRLDGAEAAAAGEERALGQLLVAGAWADAHASMLAASLGQSAALVASGMSAGAELHLFTDRPKASRRLLETSVNVHLLARVEVGGQRGWYCTDLN